MNEKQQFPEYYKRYLKSTYCKNLFFSMIIGLMLFCLSLIIFWFIKPELYWISFVLSGISIFINFGIISLIKKPNSKNFYHWLENLDIKQRAITMYEFKDTDSLLVQKQRKDTIDIISKQDKNKLRILPSLGLLISLFVLFLISVLLCIPAIMASNKVIPGGHDIIEKIEDKITEVKEYEIVFETEGDGFIDGDLFQLVKEGEDSTPVMAIAEDGWYFDSWGFYSDAYESVIPFVFDSPEYTDPYKQLINVRNNSTLYAIFREIHFTDDDEKSNKLEQPKENIPQRPTNDNLLQMASGSNGVEGGGKYQDSNQVIDGSTYYGDTVFDNAYTDAMEQIQQDGDNTNEELKKIIGDYYETIEK